MSSILFSNYINDHFNINGSGIGCDINDLSIKQVFHVDDLGLPCAIALQELINVCYKYNVEIDLNFKATKSYCVAFTPKLSNLALPSLHINDLPMSL